MVFSAERAAGRAFRAASIGIRTTRGSHAQSQQRTARTSATMSRMVLLGDAAPPRQSSEEARLPCLMERRLVRSSEMWVLAPMACLAAKLASILRLFFSTGDYHPKTARMTTETSNSYAVFSAASATSSPEPLVLISTGDPMPSQLTTTVSTSSLTVAAAAVAAAAAAAATGREAGAERHDLAWARRMLVEVDDAASTSSPESLVPESTRVVAVGDVHGDIEVLVRTLLLAKLIDEQLQWAGGDATLVQLGDVLDRGDSERECWDLLQRLKSDAPKAGGRVICMIGNHEAMNVLGDSRPSGVIHANGETSFGPDREDAWRQGGPLAKELAECPVIAIIGDSVFVHGGLPLDITREGIERINKQMRRFLLDPTVRAEDTDRLDKRLLFQNDAGATGECSVSPLWDRRLSSPPDCEPSHGDAKALRASLKRLGVGRVVVGHTVQSTINSACFGAVWRCDTGMSRWVCNGPVEALEITSARINSETLNSVMTSSGVRVLRERSMLTPEDQSEVTQTMLFLAHQKDQMETLCAMFPWAEHDLVLVVLEGISYDLEAAVNGLLGMCDVCGA